MWKRKCSGQGLEEKERQQMSVLYDDVERASMTREWQILEVSCRESLMMVLRLALDRRRNVRWMHWLKHHLH
jgi:hypothetical protein